MLYIFVLCLVIAVLVKLKIRKKKSFFTKSEVQRIEQIAKSQTFGGRSQFS